MNCVQCPECGASELPAQSTSCPDCGYAIVTLSGFNIRERLREAAPEQATEKTQSPLTDPGVSKGKKLKAKLSRAKDALSKKAKSKKSLEEIVLPQIRQLPTDGNESSSNDLSATLRLQPAVLVEPQEQTVIQQIPQNMEEVKAIPEPDAVELDPEPAELKEQAIIQPEVTVDRITLAGPDEPSLQNLQEVKAIPEPDSVKLEPEVPAEPQEPPIVQPEVAVDRITLAGPDEPSQQNLEEVKAISESDAVELHPEPAELQEQAIIQPEVTVDRITVAGPDEPSLQNLEEVKATPEPDAVKPEPEVPAEPQEKAIIEPEVTVDRITLRGPDEQTQENLEEVKAIPELDAVELEPEVLAEPQEQTIIQPEVTVDRNTLPGPDEQTIQTPEEVKAIPEPDIVEPAATPEHEEKSVPVLINNVRHKTAPFAGFQLSARDTSPSTEAFQCYECGTEVDANANFCPSCRASLLRRLCPACRRLVAGNTSFCAFCGTPASALAEPPRNFSTIFAVLIIAITAIVIYLAKDFIFEDPVLDKNLVKTQPEKSTPPLPEQTNIPPSKQVDSLNSTKNAGDVQPGGTPEPRPNKNGLIESTIREDGSVQQDSMQQLPSQGPEKANPPQQSTLNPTPVVERPKEAQRATTLPPAGSNRGQIAGIPSYKHRDPGLARYLNSVGYRLIRQRRYDEAVPLLKRSVSYFPENTNDIVYAYALFNLGHALRMSGRATEAIPVLEARMKIDNQRETVRRELAAARVAALRAPLR